MSTEHGATLHLYSYSFLFYRSHVHMKSPTVSLTTWEHNKGEVAISSGFLVSCKYIFDCKILTQKNPQKKPPKETETLNICIPIKWVLKEDQNITNSRTGCWVNALNILYLTGCTEWQNQSSLADNKTKDYPATWLQSVGSFLRNLLTSH